MKKIKSKDGIAGWKIDSPIERFLAKKADKNFFGKKLYVLFYQIFDKPYYNKGLKLIEKTMNEFCDKDILQNKIQCNEYIIDMIYSLHRFGCMFDEYFLYDFYHKNTHGRLEYITDKIRYNYYEKFNGYNHLALFNDKLKTYELFKKYYHRNVIGIYSLDDKSNLDSFLTTSIGGGVIVKPINSSGGRGVQILKYNEINIESLLQNFPDGVIFEEVLQNHQEFSQFNKSSLNSVRVTTIRLDTEVIISFAVARFGRKGFCVDNAFLGGIIANIDIETGVITKAKDEKGEEYIYHPDSNCRFIGYEIPLWKEAKEFVKELAKIVPENRYTGWDIAYIKDGEMGKWVMIEANPRGQFLSQIATGRGMRKEIDCVIKKLEHNEI